MKTAVNSILGAVKSKLRFSRVNRKGAMTMANEIGPEGIVGAKNFNTHSSTIKSLLKQGKTQEAVDYVKKQKDKVYNQVKKERYSRMKK